MLSFHHVREAIASGIGEFFFITGYINPADILSKHWRYSQIKERLKSLLFWQEDTTDIILVHYAGSNNPHIERKYIERQHYEL
jgi:hypothetical protein